MGKVIHWTHWLNNYIHVGIQYQKALSFENFIKESLLKYQKLKYQSFLQNIVWKVLNIFKEKSKCKTKEIINCDSSDDGSIQ